MKIDKFLDIHMIVTFKVWISAIPILFEYGKSKRINIQNTFHENRVELF